LSHARSPNYEVIEKGERVFVHTLAAIAPGEELFIDNGLSVDGAVTDDIRTPYTRHCGASACRRSMLGNGAESALSCCRADDPMSDASCVPYRHSARRYLSTTSDQDRTCIGRSTRQATSSISCYEPIVIRPQHGSILGSRSIRTGNPGTPDIMGESDVFQVLGELVLV
jgi:hypothetical protein